MRISDDRYSRERLRMELALRFLQHEARTQTIRTWTGLSDDRIRKLYRSYMSEAALPAAASRQVAAPGDLLHPLAAPAAGDGGARQRAVAARRGAGGHSGQRGRPAGSDTRRAAVPGVRGVPRAAAGGADLVRARGVPRYGADARRSAATRGLHRVRRPARHRVFAVARASLPPLLERAAHALSPASCPVDCFTCSPASLGPRRRLPCLSLQLCR